MQLLKSLAHSILWTLFWLSVFPFALAGFLLLCSGILVIVAALAAVILAFLVLLAAILIVLSPVLYLSLVAYAQAEEAKKRKDANVPHA